MSPGSLIAIEGIDGAGKTTQAEMLAAALEAAEYRVVVTKEPTSGSYGAKIRALSIAGTPVPPEEELRYFIEDRKQHVRDLIAPAMESGAVVISDRYYLSNVAYQGARGLPPERILCDNETRFPRPAAFLLLEVTPEEGLRRVVARGGELNQFYERVDFLQQAAAIFDGIDRPHLKRIAGERPPAAVHADVRAALADQFRFV